MDIFIREVDNQGVFDAYLDGELLVRRSATPLLTAARTLLALGTNPDMPLRMWHDGVLFPALETTVRTAARLKIGTSSSGQPIFKNYGPGKPGALDEVAE